MHVPIELLTAGRDLTEPTLSPDGSMVAFVQRWRGATAIMVISPDGGAERLLSTGPDPSAGRGMSGGCLCWHPSGLGAVYAAVDGEIWWQPIGGAAVQLTALGRECRAPNLAPNGEYFVFAVDNAEIWKQEMDVQPSAVAPVRLDSGSDSFCFDPAVSPCSSTVVWQGWSPPDMPWDGAGVVTCAVHSGELSRWQPHEAAAQQPRFVPDGSRVWIDDANGWLNVRVDGELVLAESAEQAGPTWGMGQRSFAVSPDSSHVALCRNEGGFGRLVVVERSSGRVTNVGKGGHGQLTWVGDRLVALRTGAVTPTQIVAYDLSDLTVKPTRTVLAVGPAAGWDKFDLPEPSVIEIDGLHARRYAAGAGRTLVWVHGGPTDQWQADFRPRISYWWSRGWDVLVVDPHGTTGHGRDYQRALNGQWGRLDVDDTAVLIRYAHAEGWATPETTVIIGASSGGLTVVAMLADYCELVAAGVTSYPVSDVRALADVTHRFEAHYTDTLVGDKADQRLFVELSPINRAEQITKPLLIFHGSDDPVVPLEQSKRLVDRASDVVTLVVYEGEGHGFRDSANTRDELKRTAAFLRDSVPSWHL